MRSDTYFISDLHLGARYITDPRAHQMRVVKFLESIAPTAKRLFLLGDVLDYWWEYSTVVPKGFTRFFGALARLADQGVEITWLKGNHDIWIFDYLPSEIGFTLHDGPLITEIDGHSFFLEHGDGVGHQPLSFRLLRRLFRCRPAQILYSLLPPRLTIGFAHSWSSHSRKAGGYVNPTLATAENPLVKFAREYCTTHPDTTPKYFIFGHQHITLDTPIPPASRLIVLGNWINQSTYARWDGKHLSMHEFTEF